MCVAQMRWTLSAIDSTRILDIVLVEVLSAALYKFGILEIDFYFIGELFICNIFFIQILAHLI